MPAIKSNSATRPTSSCGKRKALAQVHQTTVDAADYGGGGGGGKRRSLSRPKLRVGFICGREDDDHVTAPGIPKEFWHYKSEKPDKAEKVCSVGRAWGHPTAITATSLTASARTHSTERSEDTQPGCHCWQDVALWWYVKQHYPTVECDMILPKELSAARLQSNDINLLLGARVGLAAGPIHKP